MEVTVKDGVSGLHLTSRKDTTSEGMWTVQRHDGDMRGRGRLAK